MVVLQQEAQTPKGNMVLEQEAQTPKADGSLVVVLADGHTASAWWCSAEEEAGAEDSCEEVVVVLAAVLGWGPQVRGAYCVGGGGTR